MTKVPKRISTALLNSLGAGVVPRIGLEYIAVGRKAELEALLQDVDNIGEGGAAFRFIVGRYGSGKSFLIQILRNYAMDRGYVTADADLSPERRLTGSKGQGLSTYRELMQNLAAKTRPEGGALSSILERWLSSIQSSITLSVSDVTDINAAVENEITKVINSMEGMIHGFDFSKVINSYWQGYISGDDSLKDGALKWLRGEFTTKTEAKNALGVNVIIDDDNWYDYIKLFTTFICQVGYKGLLIFIDEAVNLYKISNSQSRQGNYEKILSMFNDTMQGKAQNLGIIMGCTPQFVEDMRRGLFSYEALRSRLTQSRFLKDGLKDMSSPLIYLNTLTEEEIYVLLNKLVHIHSDHYNYETAITHQDIIDFMQCISDRVGAEALLTPRELIRDFVSLLNILHQHKDESLNSLLKGNSFTFNIEKNTDKNEDDFMEFSL